MIDRTANIIYVEDDASSAEILVLYLEQKGFKVSHYDNAEDAQRAIKNISFDVAILDVMLPKGNGLELLKLAVQTKLPSIMVTAKVSESDRIHGFELGADDYVCKPYSPRELVSRVSALLNRTQRNHQLTVLEFEQLTINLAAHSVSCDGKFVTLTNAEYLLLSKIAAEPQRVFTRQQLLDMITQEQNEVTERTVDTHLANLRKKLNDSKKNPRFIATRYGQGYQFIAKKVNYED